MQGLFYVHGVHRVCNVNCSSWYHPLFHGHFRSGAPKRQHENTGTRRKRHFIYVHIYTHKYYYYYFIAYFVAQLIVTMMFQYFNLYLSAIGSIIMLFLIVDINRYVAMMQKLWQRGGKEIISSNRDADRNMICFTS